MDGLGPAPSRKSRQTTPPRPFSALRPAPPVAPATLLLHSRAGHRRSVLQPRILHLRLTRAGRIIVREKRQLRTGCWSREPGSGAWEAPGQPTPAPREPRQQTAPWPRGGALRPGPLAWALRAG